MCSDSTTCLCDELDSDRVAHCPECGDEIADGNERRGKGCLHCQRCPECSETLAACEGLGGCDCQRAD